MAKPTPIKHPSKAFELEADWANAEDFPMEDLSADAKKKPSKKDQRLALYATWTDVIRSRIEFQGLAIAREPGELFHTCRYMLQADFSNPGHLLVTIFISKNDPKSPKKHHNELRRQRKIWLTPKFQTVKDIAVKKETITGINIDFDVHQSFSVDPDSAFLTFDIETDTVPSQKKLDSLFTKKPYIQKEPKSNK